MVQKRARNKKWIWIGGGVLLAIVIAGIIVGVVVSQNNGNDGGGEDNKVEESGVTATAEDQGGDSGEMSEAEKFVEEEVAKKKTVKYEGPDPNDSPEITGSISYAGVLENMLTIRVNIDQYVTEGTCDLKLNQGGVTVYNTTAAVMGEVATATCEGFDVPVSELGSGIMEIVVNVNAGGKSGVLYGEVNI